MYICELCGKEFKLKKHLDQHKNKKKVCNIHTNYQCSKCKKYFRYKKNLIEHIRNLCSDKLIETSQIDDNMTNIIKQSIRSFLLSSMLLRQS